MTAAELKELLSTPLALFLMMLLASLGSALKQMWVARKQDVKVTFSSYFLEHWPETIIMLGTNVFAFVSLIMNDSLNWAAAIGIGYLANDAADAFTKTGRSAEIQNGRQAGFARLPMLAMLATAVLIVLAFTGCATNQVTGERELTEGGKAALREVAAIGMERYAEQNADSKTLQRVRTALLELSELPESDTMSVALLKSIVQDRINSNVSGATSRG